MDVYSIMEKIIRKIRKQNRKLHCKFTEAYDSYVDNKWDQPSTWVYKIQEIVEYPFEVTQKVLRSVEYAFQRKNRGFDDEEIWSLDGSFCDWALPRLRRLKELKPGLPYCQEANRHYTEEEWDHIMDQIIEEIETYDKHCIDGNPAKPVLFIKHLNSLWV